MTIAGACEHAAYRLDNVGREIVERVLKTAAGAPTVSERLLHQEFILGYKTFEPCGPACLPNRRLGS